MISDVRKRLPDWEERKANYKTYSGPCQLSLMEVFWVDVWQGS